MGARSLKILQLQMEAWITSRSGMKRLKKDIAKHIHSSPELPADKRVEIYQRMYWTRMFEVLKSDFPVLAACLEASSFQDLCYQYIQSCPSESYTLNQFGAKFAGFVASKSCDLKNKNAWRDLASLEWTLKESFHSPLASKNNVLPFPKRDDSDLMSLVLQPAPSLKTMILEHKVSPLFEKFHSHESIRGEVPEPIPEYLVIFRQQNRSVFQSLDAPTWSFMQALLEGHNIETAIEEVAPLLQKDEDCVTILSHTNAWIAQQAFVPKN